MKRLQLASAALLGCALVHGSDYTSRYRDQLKGLDATQPESVCAARAGLRQWLPPADSNDRAALFRAFRDFYLAGPRTTNRQFSNVIAPFSRYILGWLSKEGSPAAVRELLASRPEIGRVAARWLDCGYLISAAEGDLYPAPDPAAFEEFTPFLPPDLAGYLRFRALEDAQMVVYDACLRLTWEQLRERLARWEAFGRQNPQLPETAQEVRPQIGWLAWFYFLGVDNTPTYDYSTGKIEPLLIASWSRLATLDRESHYHGLAAVLVSEMKAHDGRITRDDRALFEHYGLGDAFDLWWRTFQLHTTTRPR